MPDNELNLLEQRLKMIEEKIDSHYKILFKLLKAGNGPVFVFILIVILLGSLVYSIGNFFIGIHDLYTKTCFIGGLFGIFLTIWSVNKEKINKENIAYYQQEIEKLNQERHIIRKKSNISAIKKAILIGGKTRNTLTSPPFCGVVLLGAQHTINRRTTPPDSMALFLCPFPKSQDVSWLSFGLCLHPMFAGCPRYVQVARLKAGSRSCWRC